jgi:hypothetical protein
METIPYKKLKNNSGRLRVTPGIVPLTTNDSGVERSV